VNGTVLVVLEVVLVVVEVVVAVSSFARSSSCWGVNIPSVTVEGTDGVLMGSALPWTPVIAHKAHIP
jgi:hypothetical protein